MKLENWSSGFPARSDTNWPVQSQKQARNLKFQIEEEDCTIGVGISYCKADLCLCFRTGKNPVFS